MNAGFGSSRMNRKVATMDAKPNALAFDVATTAAPSAFMPTQEWF